MPSPPPLPQKVLVIDDDEVMRDLLSLILGAEGHEILLAGSGQSALDLLATLESDGQPGVLLTDLQMPGLTGARLAARLRKASPHAQLIAMSGTRPPASKLTAFDAFLQKPFTAADFAAAITANASPSLSETAAADGPGTLPDLDEAVYAKLTATMPSAQLKQLYAMCFDDAATRLARMAAAASTGDADTFTREAHAIKGGTGMLGARQLHDLAARMEKGALQCTSLLNDFPIAAQRLRRMLDARA